MASSMWKAGDDVMATVRDLVAKYHPHLALCDDEIAVVFKEAGSKIGDVEIIGKTAKAPEIISVLGSEVKWKFIITLAQDAWQKLNDKQRMALLDHHLCGCRVEENAQTGMMKCFVAPPDVSFYKGELERWGAWRHDGAPPSANLLQELFGSDAP